METGVAMPPATVVHTATPVSPIAGHRSRPRWVGRVALVSAVLTIAAVATGIVLATADLYLAAWIAGFAAVGLSLVAVLAGAVAVLGRWGRAAGFAAIAVGILANPLLLTTGLGLIAGQ